jgi:hypothetical protein
MKGPRPHCVHDESMNHESMIYDAHAGISVKFFYTGMYVCSAHDVRLYYPLPEPRSPHMRLSRVRDCASSVPHTPLPLSLYSAPVSRAPSLSSSSMITSGPAKSATVIQSCLESGASWKIFASDGW